MISCVLEPLPEESFKQLREFVNRPEMKLLHRVIEAHAKNHLVNALNGAAIFGDHPLKLDAANVSLIEAQKYVHALSILKGIANTDDFKVAKLT